MPLDRCSFDLWDSLTVLSPAESMFLRVGDVGMFALAGQQVSKQNTLWKKIGLEEET